MEKEAKDVTGREFFAFVCGFVTGLGLVLYMMIIILWGNPRYDTYSLALTAVDGFSDPATSGPDDAPPLLSPAFNLTLRVENAHLVAKRCFSEGRVAVSYGGIALGEGRVPGWCAAARSTAEVSAVARGEGVQLPDGLRKRVEAELRWGTAEVDVEAKLFRDDKTQAPVLLWCKAAGPQVPLQPLRCTAFTDFVV